VSRNLGAAVFLAAIRIGWGIVAMAETVQVHV
jgi:hypothetical protein